MMGWWLEGQIIIAVELNKTTALLSWKGSESLDFQYGKPQEKARAVSLG